MNEENSVGEQARPAGRLKMLLVESLHSDAGQILQDFNLVVDSHPDALSEGQLSKMLRGVHILGIGSRTRVTEQMLNAAPQLLAIGCFCLGTDHVDMEAATRRGVAVFNAPFSNTRSVAELTIAEVVILARSVMQRSLELHSGRWEKSAKGCVEVRHKTIGVVGYGQVGPQVGLLAESFGMKVVFYDALKRLPLGNARQLGGLEELLGMSDFVTLHVPDSPRTRGMIGREQLHRMPAGSYLLNLGGGSVVDIDALRDALTSGHLAGAAIDVFPKEPSFTQDPFVSELRGLKNVILTPHIGGNTEEAQLNIETEVSESLISYVETGSSINCANLPEVQIPAVDSNGLRILNIHKDMPGVLSQVDGLIAGMMTNIKAQACNTRNGVGYLIMDVERNISRDVQRQIESLESNIRTRLLF